MTPDYLPHQLWSFCKNTSSAASYVLATSCLLQALGMQAESALPLSAAANWVLKDGLGSLGVMAAASRFGKAMDSRLRLARWVSELGMVAGVAIEMLTPLFPPGWFLPVASVANMCKGLSALTGGASKAAFHRHFAIDSNLANVTAMAHSQHTAAYTLGTALGVLFTSLGFSPWLTFVALSSIQLLAVRQATAAVALASLDAQRGPMLVQQYLNSKSVVTPAEMRALDRFEWPFVTPFRLPHNLVVGASVQVFENVSQLEAAQKKSNGKPFWIHWDGATAHIVLLDEAREQDIVEAVFIACCEAQGNGGAVFSNFKIALERSGWRVDECTMETSAHRIRVKAVASV